MDFRNYEQMCEYYRKLADYRLMPNTYVIAMLDGRSFSTKIKNKYKLPFDDAFINIMDGTAKYLLNQIPGAKFAYVQSDEISILITDFEKENTGTFYNNRLCKLQSIFAGMASSKFNQLSIINEIKRDGYRIGTMVDCEDTLYGIGDTLKRIEGQELVEFDCRAWNAPYWELVFNHFLWRQTDCIKNSKQQTAQTLFSHKELLGLNADEQVDRCREKGVFWDEFRDGWKYGRLIYREEVRKYSEYVDGRTNEVKTANYTRNEFVVHDAVRFEHPENVIRYLIPER